MNKTKIQTPVDPNENVTHDLVIHDVAERCLQSMLRSGIHDIFKPEDLAKISYNLAEALHNEGNHREEQAEAEEQE